MEAESKTQKREAPAPSYLVRASCWWGIFLLVSMPYCMVLLSPLFPTGLGYIYCRICIWIFSFLPVDPVTIRNLFDLPAILLAYATYMVHFVLTRQAKFLRTFLLLMLSLGLLVSANLVGCAREEDAMPAFQN